MKNINPTDTIAAISTPLGESGIGIVRLSGKDALSIVDKIFVSRSGKKVSSLKTYTMHYGFIVDPRKGMDLRKTEIVDEVILTLMRAPRSYTKEDIVEINCHGGIVALRRVLELVLENGCRVAGPGEFTQRAFLNGRIDLAQAEAVIDIIRAKTGAALDLGLRQLRGVLSKEINKIRQGLLEIAVLIEANIDFPDEADKLDPKAIRKNLEDINTGLERLLKTKAEARIMREGISVVICGKPNVGKSSLLNALLKQERSIVTSIPGTTRDTIEEIISIRGIPVRILDTAGILEPRDLVERKAVARSKEQIKSADLVLVLFDGSKALSRDDFLLIKRLKKKTGIAVINKIDLKQRIEKDRLLEEFRHVVQISARKCQNIPELEEQIAGLFFNGNVSGSESALVGSLRHIEALKSAKNFVACALDSLDNRLSLEFIAQDVKEGLSCLDDLLGKRFSDSLLDKIFADFCIGK